jgi:hypothetical protein
MEQSHNDINNNNNPDRRKTAIESKIYHRFITTIALPTVLLVLLTLIAGAPISPVQATGGGDYGNETTATPAPGGASLGPAANETNVTSTAAAQSACLSQNATTTGRPAVDAGAATTTNNTTTTTVAPGGASIGANDTSTSPAPVGNATTGNTTTATVAPSGASVC